MIDAGTLYLVLGAAVAALSLLLLLVRGRRARSRAPVLSERVRDERPYLRAAPPPAPAAVTDEVAAAATDVVGDLLRVPTRDEAAGDDLQMLKGVGPKLAARLHELGITSFAQLAGMSEAEVGRLDERLGPFRGRAARDRLAEQARYLERGDTDGFEARFGKLGTGG